MNSYSLTHLSDAVLLSNLGALVVQGRENMAALLAHVAEMDARKLYLPAGYPSMYDYCMREMHLTGDEALSRIRVARTAREYPTVFASLADGRLSFSAVLLLAPHLTRENANDLLAAAVHKTRLEIQNLVAKHFPKPAVPASLRPLLTGMADSVGTTSVAGSEAGTGCEQELSLVSKRVDATDSRPRVQPLSAESYALQCTISRETHELLRYAQALLGHKIPAGDLPEVLKEALLALVHNLEKVKFAATSRPRPRRASSNEGSRYVPAEVKRAVWERDGGQCTFVGSNGRRCPSRTLLEFDHVEPFARGGEATVEGMRLLCRGHNQYTAERTFGAGFMSQRRESARQAAEERRAQAAAEVDPELDVVPWLRALGARADEARKVAASCDFPRRRHLRKGSRRR